MRLRLLLVSMLAALAASATPARVEAANECSGIQRCIPVAGPWVSVPAHGEVSFALECPQNRGIIGGTDGQASSLDVRASFDGILASPVSFGRTTLTQAMFRAVSVTHRAGWFKPFIGCIPAAGEAGNTISSKLTPVGPPLDLRTALVGLSPGLRRTVTLACPAGEPLVDSWSATASSAQAPPAPLSPSLVRVQTTISGAHATAAIVVSPALPRASGAELQLGVRCGSG